MFLQEKESMKVGEKLRSPFENMHDDGRSVYI